MTAKLYSLDTNILLRFILKDNQTQFNRIIRQLSDPEKLYYIPDGALIETVYVLQSCYQYDRRTICSFIELLFKPLNIAGNYTLIHTVTEFWRRHPALSFTDCYLAAQAHTENRAPLLTFDQKLAHQHPAATVI